MRRPRGVVSSQSHRQVLYTILVVGLRLVMWILGVMFEQLQAIGRQRLLQLRDLNSVRIAFTFGVQGEPVTTAPHERSDSRNYPIGCHGSARLVAENAKAGECSRALTGVCLSLCPCLPEPTAGAQAEARASEERATGVEPATSSLGRLIGRFCELPGK